MVTDFSLSSSGGNPHVLAWGTSQHELANNTIQKSNQKNTCECKFGSTGRNSC